MKSCSGLSGLQDGARGSVLLLCLIFLLVFALMSAAGIERATLDARMADNLRQYDKVRHAGERVLYDLARGLIIGAALDPEVPGQAGTVAMPPYQVAFLLEDMSDAEDPGIVVRLQVEVFAANDTGPGTVVANGHALIGLIAVWARPCRDNSCSWYQQAWHIAGEMTGE